MKSVLGFVRKEPVLTAAVLLALGSMFFVPPDAGYAAYIDVRTLAILFCLMAVMAGLRTLGVFDRLGRALLRRVHSLRAMIAILWGLCFVCSMAITNDVALITFVPFTIILLDLLGPELRSRWLLPVVVMQTIAANLGSMLTPIGNPQNLYLYGLSGLSLGAFVRLMLPYTLASLVLLLLWTGIACRGGGAIEVRLARSETRCDSKRVVCYLLLFVLCLLTVARVLPYGVPLALIAAYLLLFDRKVFAKVDYALLLTFAGFFVFIGNMGRIDGFRRFLEGIIAGHEMLTAVVASQVISNVPAALLLSGFTDRVEALIVGTNLGGLGTLIASMASLISFKYIGEKTVRGRYLLLFTAANGIFLAALLLLAWFLR